MKISVSFFLLIAALLLCAFAFTSETPTALGQQRPQPAPTPTPDDSGRVVTDIKEVRLPITVLDKKGQPVMGLTKNDFLVYEDKQLQTIESFYDEKTSLPVYVAVLMDTSASTAGKLKAEQESAKDFIYTVARIRKDRVAFVTFDDEVRLHQDFTDKLDVLDRAVDKVKQVGVHTAMYDAIWQVCNEKMRDVPGRRVIVIITDGDDTYSRANLRDAIEIAQRTETIIFAISTEAGFATATVPGVEAGMIKDKGDKNLVALAEETGGTAFFIGDRLALERSFTKISKELRTQYIVTYKPLNDKYDGSTRRIEVRLANERGGLKVKTRRSYPAVNDRVASPQ
jgi:Ca-activated chloride channel family protein